MKRKNFWTTLAAASAVLVFVVFCPIPHRVWCALEITPRDAEPVYVDVPGRIEDVFVKPGERVEKGQRLARLSNMDLDVAIADLQGKREENVAKLRSLNSLRGKDNKAGDEVASVKETLHAVEQELAEKLRDQERLTLTAPAAGVVLAPAAIPAQTEHEEKLPNWSGTPLDSRNRQAWLAEGVLFCQIGDPNAMQADIIIDQSDVEFVTVGQSVDLKLDQLPGESFSSRIEQVGPQLKVSPKQLSHKQGGQLVTKTDAGGVERPESTSYEANAALSDPAAMLRPGLRGQAKIHVGYQSYGAMFARYLSKTFNFKL